MGAIIFRPLGAIFFGWIGDVKNREQAFYASFAGLMLATFCMGLLPTYQKAGYLAPCLLMACRGMQSFCMGGASSGSCLLLLEKKEKRGFLASLHALSTIFGIFLASVSLPFFMSENFWRIAFFLASLLSLFSIVLKKRVNAPDPPIEERASFSLPMLLKSIILSGFSYITYSIPFVLMNSYIPLITNSTLIQTINMGSYLIVIDMIAIVLVSPLIDRFKASTIMALSALLLFICAIPLWYGGYFLLLRILLVLCGVAFSLPLYIWMVEKAPFQFRYRLAAVGGAIGAELLGKSSTGLCLWLYQKSHIEMIPALYLTLFAFVVLWILGTGHQNKSVGWNSKRLFKRGGREA